MTTPSSKVQITLAAEATMLHVSKRDVGSNSRCDLYLACGSKPELNLGCCLCRGGSGVHSSLRKARGCG